MSKGAGTMQVRIKARLRRGETPVNRLCWELAGEAGAVKIQGTIGAGIESGVLRRSFYSGFLRALKGLSAKGDVLISSRVLTTANLADVYPYKTMQLEVRELRKVVLPHLVRYGAEKGFDWEEVERRILRSLAGTEKLLQCRAMWASMEGRLWEAGAAATVRRVLLPLLVSGSEYFTEREGSARASGSLAQHVRAAKNLLPEDLVDELRALYRLAFDRDDHERVTSKGRFFAFADFGRHQGGVELNDDVLVWLVGEIPDVVKALHGFEAARRPPEGTIDLTDYEVRGGHSFPLVLRRLVDRRIFAKHEFVRAA